MMSVDESTLKELYRAGHGKLVPLNENGVTPAYLTEEDKIKFKEDGIVLDNGYSHSWFTFIEDHPNFWTEEKLSDNYYASKFKNVAKICGYSGQNEYDNVLDIDSEYVLKKLSSPLLMEDERVKRFIREYNCYRDNDKQPSSLLDFLKSATYVTKTKKEEGYHIHWKEYEQRKQVNSTSCYPEREFELITGKHLVTLPPSRHRDDENFHYYPVGAGKVNVLGGLYDLLIELLGDCLVKKNEKKEQLPFEKPTTSNDQFLQLTKEKMDTLVEIIKPYYNKGYRNKTALALSGIFYKNSIGENTATEIISQLSKVCGDEEHSQRIITVKETYRKARKEGPESITGNSLLVDIISSQIQATYDSTEPTIILRNILKEIGTITKGKEIDDFIPPDIKYKLSPHVFKVISLNPLRLVISHSDYHTVFSGRIDTGTSEYESNNNGEKIYFLNLDEIIIDACIVQVIIYDDPINKTRKYEITFSTNKGKRKFRLGPTSLEDIIADLNQRNKILKRTKAHDALSAIISAFEEKGISIVNDKIVTPGYYIMDGKFVAIETNQSPISLCSTISSSTSTSISESNLSVNNYDTGNISSCIELLDELSKKWKKGVFSTVIKWAVVAPFGYILKQNNRWIPFIDLYGWSNAGKSTLGLIALATWRKDNLKAKNNFQLGFGNIDSVARLGEVMSRDTYPRVVNEVKSLYESRYGFLLEMLKNAIDSLVVRGKLEGYTKYTEKPSLSPLFLTSNSNSTDDTGFRRRAISIHFDKSDSKKDVETKAFRNWLEPQLDKLGVLGDFTASYLKQNQHLFKEKLEWEELAKIVIKAFYNSVGRDEPYWLNDIVEQNTIQESKEIVTEELRAFLIKEINEHYNKYVKNVENTSDKGATFRDFRNANLIDRVNFCLDNGSIIPYMHTFRNKQNEEMIGISNSVLREIRKEKFGNYHIGTLTDVANEIPGFIHGNRTIGGKSTKIAFGPRRCFIDFLTAKVEDENEVQNTS